MAGSYYHLVSGGDNPTKFSMELIENMGDAHEALEECWFAIEAMRDLLELSQDSVDQLITKAMAYPGTSSESQEPCVRHESDGSEYGLHPLPGLDKKGKYVAIRLVTTCKHCGVLFRKP